MLPSDSIVRTRFLDTGEFQTVQPDQRHSYPWHQPANMRLIATLAVVCFAVFGPPSAIADDETPSVLIGQLASPSYHTRESATRRLIAMLMSAGENSSSHSDTIRSVRDALTDDSLERRLAAAEILRLVDQTRLDRELERLVDLKTRADDLDLPGWFRFHHLFGDDQPSRKLFARLLLRFPKRLRDGDACDTSASRWSDPKMDPYYLPPNDHVRWAMLLWLDIENANVGRCERSARLAMSLSQSSMGPSSLENTDANPIDICIRRMIGVWIQNHSSITASPMTRTNLLIAMRYQCFEQASTLCDSMLDDPSLPAAASVTAMLTAARLGRGDLQVQLERRLSDDRTAHVWQVIGPGKRKVRTQVRDVALALLLHNEGIDPREVGFEDLQADPRLVFCDHSLGFEDEPARQESHDRGLKRLSLAR